MRLAFLALAAITAVLAFTALKPTLIDSTRTVSETLDQISATTAR